jgi:NADH-quinone oxidoreductase subunit J
MLDTIFFFIFAVIIIGGGLLTITRRNAVHSAIFLIATLLGIAGLFLHLHAEFLAGVQVILYVGGIMVLFLFVIMLVNLDEAAKQRQFNRQWLLGLVAGLVLLAELGYGFYRGRAAFVFPEAAAPAAGQPNAQAIGTALYQQYMLPFEIASILLLVAMVGAVVMAKKRI